jgi:MoaA/NifB/PqqE/SkfB family radical SAM enzyme
VTFPLFQRLEIETSSYCNRTCATCLRNSDPDREALAPWFRQRLLPTEVIERLMDEALAMGFHGEVCLGHYNEPTLDKRLCALGRLAKAKGFGPVFTMTNGDFLTPELGADLDTAFDFILVAFYVAEPELSAKRAWAQPMFRRCEPRWVNPIHVPNHNWAAAPRPNLLPCRLPLIRCIVNHRGESCLCCDDVIGRYGLGNVYDSSLAELWYSARRAELVATLAEAGGRERAHPHCATCPRTL